MCAFAHIASYHQTKTVGYSKKHNCSFISLYLLHKQVFLFCVCFDIDTVAVHEQIDTGSCVSCVSVYLSYKHGHTGHEVCR